MKAGLAVLVQHHLVLYLLPGEEDDTLTIYEANIRNAYNLLRFGKSGHILHNSLGEHTGHIAENLLLEGCVLRSNIRAHEHVEPRNDFQEALSNGTAHGTSLTNGNTQDSQHIYKNHIDSTEAQTSNENSPHDMLFSCGYALQCRRLDYIPDHDFDDMIERDVLDKKYGGQLKGTVAKEGYADDVRNTKRRLLDGNRLEDECMSDETSKKKKRKRNVEDSDGAGKEPSKSNKQRKLNASAACNGDRGTGVDSTIDSQASVLEGSEVSVSHLSCPSSCHD